MKKFCFLIQLAFALITCRIHGQGTFVYDQQSSTESLPGEAIVGITSFQQPVGQSFTPSLSAIGFIRLELGDGNVGNGLGTTVSVNLRTNSITGPILGFTMPVFLPDGFGGFTNFFFSIPVSVTPGVTYYFQPVIQSGDACVVGRFVPDYPGGTEYINGQPDNNDLWFREGIVVPEPSAVILVLLGVGSFICFRKRKR
jgi:hypothetical protein